MRKSNSRIQVKIANGWRLPGSRLAPTKKDYLSIFPGKGDYNSERLSLHSKFAIY
jgi:hypothetical protein